MRRLRSCSLATSSEAWMLALTFGPPAFTADAVPVSPVTAASVGTRTRSASCSRTVTTWLKSMGRRGYGGRGHAGRAPVCRGSVPGRRTSYAQVTGAVTGLVLVMAVVSITAAAGGGRPLRRRCRGSKRFLGQAMPMPPVRPTSRSTRASTRSASTSAGRTSTAPWSQPMSTGDPRRSRACRSCPYSSGAFSGTDSASGCVQGVDPGLIKVDPPGPSSFYVSIRVGCPGSSG